MTDTAERIKTALLSLPVAERLELLVALEDSLPEPPAGPPPESAEFDAMLARRVDELRSGKVRGVPADEVMARLKAKYER
jgi:putative addiction module component (TIGR02574 family)